MMSEGENHHHDIAWWGLCQDTLTPTLQKASTVRKWRYFLQKQRVTARVAGVIIIKEIKVGHARNLALTFHLWNAFITGVNVQLVFVQFHVQGDPPPPFLSLIHI